MNRSYTYLAIVAASLFFLPQKTHELDFRTIRQPLEIRIDKNSPAYSALEDSRITYVETESTTEYTSLTTSPRLHTDQLKSGMHNLAAAVVGAQTGSADVLNLRPQVISSRTNLSHISDIRDRKLRIARAYMEENPEPMTLAAVAQNLVADEMRVKSKENPNEKVLPSGIVVRKSLQSLVIQPPVAPPGKSPSGVPGLKLASNDRAPSNGRTRVIQPRFPEDVIAAATGAARGGPAQTEAKKLTAAGGASVLAAASLLAVTQLPVQTGQISVKGRINFKGGAAYLRGYDQMIVTHGYGDIVISEGVWIEKDGTFEIAIEKPTGEINAKLYSRDGVLTGEGVLHLADLKLDWATTKKVENAELTVTPAQDGVDAIVLAAESRGLPFRTNLMNAEAEILGFGQMSRENKKQVLTAKDLRRPSSMIIQASLTSFWSSIKFGFAGQRNIINIFSNNTVETFLDILEQKPGSKELQDRNIAWGSLYKDGRPLENAVVDLAFNDDAEVIYFSGPLPDRMRMMTDSNGQFAILNKTPGLQLLRVQQIGENILPSLVAFQPKTITDLNLEITKENEIEVQAMDHFSGQPLATNFNFLGEEDAMETNEFGYANLLRRQIEGLTLAEFDAGPDYMMTRVAFNHHTRLITAPLLKTKWVAQMTGSQTQNLIAGKVTGEEFEVGLEILTGNTADVKVLYFNIDGSLRAEKYGAADGSYIITGAPSGLQTVSISALRSGKQISSLVLADDRAVQFVSTNLAN